MLYNSKQVQSGIRHLCGVIFNDQKEVYEAFKIYKAARTIQKHVRGFITRRRLKKLQKCALIIQTNWRGYRSRIHAARLARKKYYECREIYYNQKAASIQRAWRKYKERQEPSFARPLRISKNIKAINVEIINKMQAFQEKRAELRNKAKIEQKMEWLNYILPKLHHLIRTKAIPGIYSLKGRNYEYSTLETLLASYDFTKFMGELTKERKKNIKFYLTHELKYQFEGVCRRQEILWKQRNVIDNPRL